MKTKILYIISTILLFTTSVNAQKIYNGDIGIDNVVINKDGNILTVYMNIDISKVKLSSNKGITLTPFLQTDSMELHFPVVKILGHKQYIYNERNQNSNLNTSQRVFLRKNNSTQNISYEHSVPYENWMQGANLYIGEDLYGCCNKILEANDQLISTINIEPPVYEYAYISPQVEEIKNRFVTRHAYIDFPINIIEIRPSYSNNANELSKINHTIETVINDSDITINSIDIKGFASPSGPYDNNIRLAKGRCAAVETYVRNKFNLNKITFNTTYEAEDWQGVSAYLDSTNITNKQALLKIANGSLAPDAREWKIKTEYPNEYRILLSKCYPALRHTDYVIKYTVRGFNVDEAKLIILQRPQNLSLQEMYLVALTYPEGSDEFNNVFDIAVRMFPEDEVANLNAANISLKNNDLQKADKYLKRAGDSPQAINARAIMTSKQGDNETAKRLFKKAVERGSSEAIKNMEKIN